MKKAVLLVLPLIAAAGFVAQAQEGQSGKASITMRKSYDVGIGFTTGTRQLYFRLPEHSCKKKKKLSAFSFITSSEKTAVIPAGQKLTLWAFTHHLSFGREAVCQNALSFTPKEGGRYEMQLKSTVASHCTIELHEVGSVTPPPDVAYHNNLQCKRVD